MPASELSDPHSSWVSYYAVDANSTNWQHKTTYVLPANTLVHVTIYNFDGASGLRNPWFGQAIGTLGGTITLNGKPTRAINADSASHVFSIPQIGLAVPLLGVADDAKNACNNAPCSLSNDHTTTSFTFRTPGKGLYRWQCFVPARLDISLGSAARCRPSATWMATSRSYERTGDALKMEETHHFRNVVLLWLLAPSS